MGFAIGLIVGIAATFMVMSIISSKKINDSYSEGYIDGREDILNGANKRKGMTTDEEYQQAFNTYKNVIEKMTLDSQMPLDVVNQNGTPLSGYCPRCNAQLTILSSPVGCKWCLQRLKWEGEQEE